MSSFEADAYLDSLEPIGWRLGLERMHKLSTALGLPQHRFASIHVVGTNGKSSTVRFCAAALRSAGLHVGAYLSPHVRGFEERLGKRREELNAEIQRAERKLGNEGFVAKAPPIVVEEERGKLERYRTELAELG